LSRAVRKSRSWFDLGWVDFVDRLAYLNDEVGDQGCEEDDEAGRVEEKGRAGSAKQA
jgi:hypothetical protein